MPDSNAPRLNVPSFGTRRIYFNKPVTASTRVAWTVLGRGAQGEVTA